MQIGAVFPQTEIGADPGAIRTYIEAVESFGYEHVLTYDHVLGADPQCARAWNGPYDVATPFHEPFVLYGYVAAFSTLELVTGIIILPQRQTALVAEQAAQVDLLTRGRFRLGVGLGWNAVEYEALGKDFSNRGARFGEQIELLRRLWTERSVTHRGTFETVTGAGLAPLPVQRPIPVWLGGQSPRAYRRIGALADGWFPQVQPGEGLDEARAVVENGAPGRPGANGPGHGGSCQRDQERNRGGGYRGRGLAGSWCVAPVGQHHASRTGIGRSTHRGPWPGSGGTQAPPGITPL